mgnify:CR=1 FL=1
MEKGLFHELYKRSCELEMGRCPSPALSGFLHGYLSVYSMVRVYPWLEESFGEPYEIHERVREIARFIEPLAGNKKLPADVRAGYVVDLMDAYQTYSDMDLLNEALDVAYRILTVDEKGEIVIPGRTPNVCRLLCSWYYFTGEEWCLEMAKGIVGDYDNLEKKQAWQWLRAVSCFKNLSEDMIFWARWKQEEKEVLGNIIVSIENIGIVGKETFCFELLGMWELKGKGFEL